MVETGNLPTFFFAWFAWWITPQKFLVPVKIFGCFSSDQQLLQKQSKYFYSTLPGGVDSRQIEWKSSSLSAFSPKITVKVDGSRKGTYEPLDVNDANLLSKCFDESGRWFRFFSFFGFSVDKRLVLLKLLPMKQLKTTPIPLQSLWPLKTWTFSLE